MSLSLRSLLNWVPWVTLLVTSPSFGFQELHCQIMNPYAHPQYAIVSSLKLKRESSGQDWILPNSNRSLQPQAGEVKTSDSWIYGIWQEGKTWLSLGKGKNSKLPKSQWVGAVVFKSRYDYEIACAEKKSI